MGAPSGYIADSEFQRGDPIWYDPIPVAGGSGFAIRVPALFVRRTLKRVVIQALRHNGTRQRLVVARERITRRESES